MNKSSIEWTDKTWNPVTGCTKVSQGCKNCYAEAMFNRFEKQWGKFTNVQCHEDRLHQPSKIKKPSKIFVNSMSDLFHEDVPFEFVYKVFSVMSDHPQHIFQVLTKRPERAKDFFGHLARISWPFNQLKHIWIGTSIEDQKTANLRIPILLDVPMPVKFLSCEPLLGAIDFSGFDFKKIDWVIVGGESGSFARPLNPEWVRSIRKQCRHANIPFFFKQWGKFNEQGEKVGKKVAGSILDSREWKSFPKVAR